MLFALLVKCAAFIVPFCLIFSLIKQRLRVVRLASKIPGPPALPILGNSLLFARAEGIKDLWEVAKGIADELSGIQRFWLGPVLAVVVGDPANVNIVLTHSASSNKHPWYSVFSYMANGVFVTNGSHYDKFRRSLGSFLHPKTVTNWHDMMAAKAVQAVQVLDKEVGKEFDISEMTLAYSLDMVCNTVLGADLNEMNDRKFNFYDALSEASAISFERIFKPQYYIDGLFRLTKKGQKFEKYCKETTAVLRYITEKRMKELQSRGVDLKSDFEEENYTDVIIKHGMKEDLSMEDIARLLCELPVAGSGTTGVTTAFALLFLAMFPEYQETAYDEQLAVLGDSDRPPTVEELGRMPFLSWVEKEVQRLQGPPMIARRTSDDMEIGGYEIPKGTTLAVLIYNIHRNPQFYEKPHEFYPYHFSPENVLKRPKNAFIPLSNGPRRCPGGLFSQLSMGTLLSVLLRHYKFSTNLKFEDVQIKYALMLESSSGYPVQITKRKR